MGTPAAATTAASGAPTVVVNGAGDASAPANGAVVQLILRQLGAAGIPAPGNEPIPAAVVTNQPSPPTKDQINAVIDALVKAGIAKDDTRSTSTLGGSFYGTFGPGTAVIAFRLNAEQVTNATKFISFALTKVEEAGVLFDAVNLVYTTADCASVANAALVAAIADGNAQAGAMAAALGRPLGDLVQAVSLSSYGKSYAGGSGSNYCSQPASLDFALTTYYSPFDPNAKPVVEIYFNVSLTFFLK